MPGMLSPCWFTVGDMSAPVGAKSTLLHRCSENPRRIYDEKTAAQQPHPEPPE